MLQFGATGVNQPNHPSIHSSNERCLQNYLEKDQILCIHQILAKRMGVHELFVDFKRACNSVRSEVLYYNFYSLGYP
jgi:hypothetical protein